VKPTPPAEMKVYFSCEKPTAKVVTLIYTEMDALSSIFNFLQTLG